MTKKRQLEKVAIKSKLGEKCFNCGKKSHYIKDYHSFISNKRKPVEELTEEAKRYQWNRNQAKAAKSTNNHLDNSDH